MQFPCEHDAVLDAAAADGVIAARGMRQFNYEAVTEVAAAPEHVRRVGTVDEALVRAHFHPTHRALVLYLPHSLVMPIGFLVYERISVGDLQLHILIIDAPFQSSGYGSAALRFVRRLGAILGARRVRLAAYQDGELIRFYEKNGFQIVDEQCSENHVAMAADTIRL